MRINLGCGDRYAEDWTNVDFGSPHRKDLEVDLTGPLPEEWREKVTHAYLGHVLEHLTLDQCAELLARLLPCMDPTGALMMIVGPDVPLAGRMIADGTFDFTYHNLDSLKYGAGRWSGDVHLWECSADAVVKLCRDAGWPVVADIGIRSVDQTWPVADRAPQWQCAVRAYTGVPAPW